MEHIHSFTSNQQITNSIFLKKGSRHGKHKSPDYYKKYRKTHPEKKIRNTPQRKAQLHRNYLERKKKKEAERWLTDFENSLNRKSRRAWKTINKRNRAYNFLRKLKEQQFIDTFQNRSSCVIPLVSHLRGGKKPLSKESFKEPYYKNNTQKRQKANNLLKSGLNYGVLCGKKNFYQDYILVVIDFDCGGFAKVAFVNDLSYVATGKGIHIYCLVKKETWEQAAYKLGIIAKDGLVIKIGDLKCGGEDKKSFVVGVGSTHTASGLKYELRNLHAKNGFYYKGETIEDIYKLLNYFNIRKVSDEELMEANYLRTRRAIWRLGIEKSTAILQNHTKQKETDYKKQIHQFKQIMREEQQKSQQVAQIITK